MYEHKCFFVGGLEQRGWGLGQVSKGLGGWGLGRVSKGLEGWGLEGTGGRGAGAWRDRRSFVPLFARTAGNYPPLFYRTSSPSGPLPKSSLFLADPVFPKEAIDS